MADHYFGKWLYNKCQFAKFNSLQNFLLFRIVQIFRAINFANLPNNLFNICKIISIPSTILNCNNFIFCRIAKSAKFIALNNYWAVNIHKTYCLFCPHVVENVQATLQVTGICFIIKSNLFTYLMLL